MEARKEFTYGDRVTIFGTGSDLDGEIGCIVGAASRNIVDFYIVSVSAQYNQVTGEKFSAVTLPASCLQG